ncbi:DotU family type IV/VI secretion system protein, partial [candidate division CSSED10-310 bacterium]
MRLIDCYAELLAYTGYFLKSLEKSAPEYEHILKNYQALINRSQHMSEAADFSMKMWRDGFFPICSWIDESIMCSAWPGKDTWQRSQLQKTYFKTTTAGREFYSKLERLSKEETEVQEVYEYCLALGFRGMHYNPLDNR